MEKFWPPSSFWSEYVCLILVFMLMNSCKFLVLLIMHPSLAIKYSLPCGQKMGIKKSFSFFTLPRLMYTSFDTRFF